MPKKLTIKRVDKGFPATVARHHLTTPVKEHFHEGTEMVIVHSGLATHEVNGVPSSVRKGDVYVIGPGCSHGFQNVTNLIVYNLSFDPNLLELFSAELVSLPGYQALFVITPRSNPDSPFSCHLKLSSAELLRLEALVDKVAVQLKEQKPGFGALVKAHLGEIVSFLSQQYPGEISATTSATFFPIAYAASFMEEHFQVPVRLNQLYEPSGFSERHFTRLFKKCYGMSAIDYLFDVRLTKAAKQLLETDHLITDVALSVGFEDSNYFSRIFKKKMGKSPRAYRSDFLTTPPFKSLPRIKK